MRFVSVRELRLKPASVWKLAKQEQDLIITANGRPVAILTGVSENTLEEELEAIQRARALSALDRIHKQSVTKGTHKISGKEVDREIAAVRKRKDDLKVVLDTNVLVSAFLKPSSKPARVLRLILQGGIQIVVNEHILEEYWEALSRPKVDLDPRSVRISLDTIRSKGIRAPALPQSHPLPDPGDEPFLEATLAVEADALITGNKRHFPKESCRGQKIVSPDEFLDGLAR